MRRLWRHGRTSRRSRATSGSAGPFRSRKMRQGASMLKGCAQNSRKGCGDRAAGPAVRIAERPFVCREQRRSFERVTDQPRTSFDAFNSGSLRTLIEEEINGGDLAVPGDDEIRPGVCWCLTGVAGYPFDPSAIAHRSFSPKTP
jgi:hypothetical protein